MAVFVLLGLYVWTRPTRLPLIAIAVTDYPQAAIDRGSVPVVTPNSWAREDVDRLSQVNPSNVIYADTPPSAERVDRDSFFIRLRQGFATSAGDSRFSAGGGPSHRFMGTHERNLVVFLSVHGAVNGYGEPCLLLTDADPWDSSTWLPFSKVLEQFRKWRQEDGFTDTRIVLLLDAGRMHVNPRMGIFASQFPDSLRRLVEREAPRNLLIMLSHSQGQRSWEAPEQGGSVFGIAVTDALDGAADAAPTGNGDRVVTLQELQRYVQRYVSAWVRRYRDEDQSPTLITAARDVDLVDIPPSTRAPINAARQRPLTWWLNPHGWSGSPSSGSRIRTS